MGREAPWSAHIVAMDVSLIDFEPKTSPETAVDGQLPLFKAWLAARTACSEHDKELDSAMQRRPVYAHPGWQAYQDTVMAPLIAERDRLREAEKDAKAAMNVGDMA